MYASQSAAVPFTSGNLASSASAEIKISETIKEAARVGEEMVNTASI